MKKLMQVKLTILIALVLMWFGSPARAANGTAQERVVTFADSTTGTATFKVNPIGQDEAASVVVEFAPEGNANAPLSAEPFSTPASVTFSVKYNGTAISGFEFNADNAASTYSTPVAGTSVGTSLVQLVATKAGVGRYTVSLFFPGPTGAADLGEDWTLEIAGLPTNTRALMTISQGVFKSITPNGAPGCPAGQSCQAPCSSGCTAPAFCHGPCPGGPLNICERRPWICYGHFELPPKPIPFPWPGPECLSCPAPWMERIPDGYDRVIVEFIALDKEGKLLGPDAAKQIRVNIEGGEAIGELLDQGDGQYAQAIQFRKGNPPRVSTTIMGATSEEIIADPLAQAQAEGGAGIYKTLTYVLSILLAIALAASFVLWRRAQAPQAATGG